MFAQLGRIGFVLLWGVVAGLGGDVALDTRGSHVAVGGVWVNGTGPYRMLVDTGAESVSLRPGLAGRAGLRPKFAVELESVIGITVVAGAVAERVEVGGVGAAGVEVLLAEPPAVKGLGEMDGVLGQSFLRKVHYWMDYGRGRLAVSEGEMELEGERVEMELVSGRPAIRVKLRGQGIGERRMVVDSGASDVILFGWEGKVGGAAWLRTASREARAGMVRLESVRVGGKEWRGLRAGVVAGARPGEGGLLPARMLGSFYVNSARRYVLLEPRASGRRSSGRE